MNLPVPYTICVRGRLLDLGRPRVMGILNVTPDSFHAESRLEDADALVARALAMVDEGATMLDVGACSTRPMSEPVSEAEELARLRRVVPSLREACPDVVLSVDTFRPEVARRCVEEWGVDMVNDVGGLPAVGEPDGQQLLEEETRRQRMFQVIGALHVPYVLTSRESRLHEMLIGFARDVQRLRDAGVSDILLDPGFGFGKQTADNFALLSLLSRLSVMGLPLLVGVSRKRMIAETLGVTAAEALNGTTALHMIALQQGAAVLRVHDVREAVECVMLMEQMTDLQPKTQ